MNKKYHEIVKKTDRIHFIRKIILDKAGGEDIKLYFGQLPILEFIVRNEGCNQKDICEFIKVSPASIALSTKRLAKAGLITKVSDNQNRRCNILTPTQRGIEISQLCRKNFDEFESRLFEGFSEEELNFLNKSLDKMMNNISANENFPKDFFSLAELAKPQKGRK